MNGYQGELKDQLTRAGPPPTKAPAMQNRRTPPTPRRRNHTDWTSAALTRVQAPCHYCGGPASLRHPDTGVPCHKVCDDRHQQQTIPVD